MEVVDASGATTWSSSVVTGPSQQMTLPAAAALAPGTDYGWRVRGSLLSVNASEYITTTLAPTLACYNVNTLQARPQAAITRVLFSFWCARISIVMFTRAFVFTDAYGSRFRRG